MATKIKSVRRKLLQIGDGAKKTYDSTSDLKATRPAYLRGLESDNDSATEFAYKMYLNGRIPVYAN